MCDTWGCGHHGVCNEPRHTLSEYHVRWGVCSRHATRRGRHRFRRSRSRLACSRVLFGGEAPIKCIFDFLMLKFSSLNFFPAKFYCFLFGEVENRFSACFQVFSPSIYFFCSSFWNSIFLLDVRQSIWSWPNSCSMRFTVYSSFLKLSHAPGSMVVLPDFQFLKVALGRNRFASFSSRPKTTMIFTSPFSPHYFSPFESKMFSLTVIIISFLSNDPRVGGCGYPAILPLLFSASFLLWPTFFRAQIIWTGPFFLVGRGVCSLFDRGKYSRAIPFLWQPF